MKKIITLVIASSIILGACSRPQQAKEVLEKQGYTEVETQGYSLFGCSEDDVFRTKFTAKSPSEEDVEGVVCSGWFKGATIRFNF